MNNQPEHPLCTVCGVLAKLQLTGKGKPYWSCQEHKLEAFALRLVVRAPWWKRMLGL